MLPDISSEFFERLGNYRNNRQRYECIVVLSNFCEYNALARNLTQCNELDRLPGPAAVVSLSEAHYNILQYKVMLHSA